MKLSVQGPREHGAHHDFWTCTSHDTPVLYTSAGREVCEGQHLSMPGRQFSLHKWLPIRNFPQSGPYTCPYCTKAHYVRERKIEVAQESAPTLCHDIPPVVSHQDAQVFSPSVLSRGEKWTALPARANIAHAVPALTKTAAPNPAASAFVRRDRRNSNPA